MNIELYRNHCMLKKGVSEGFPFDKKTLVFKVMGKMFALTDIDNFKYINLKCHPEEAIILREKYDGVLPAYHMNKQHWNSVNVNTDVPDKIIFKLIDDSYNLVVTSLSKKLQKEHLTL